jgi:beta-galactosidase
MFKKFAVFLTVLFVLTGVSLAIFWHHPTSLELYSETNVSAVYRINLDLGGKWNKYSSLQEMPQEESGIFTGESSIVLPSAQGFKVAAKSFSVSSKWGTAGSQLVLEGVNGKVRVFLNGIREANFLGEYESSGGTCYLDLAPARLDYKRENILYLDMSPSGADKRKLFSWLWPQMGTITGKIRLEAVSESTIDISSITINYKEPEKIVVNLTIRHHQSLDHGPWAISGTLKKDEQTVAECLLPVNSNGEYLQKVSLVFDLEAVNLWSPEEPFLYELDLLLTNNRGQADRVQMPIGISKKAGSPAAWQVNGEKFTVKAQIITKEQEQLLRNKQQIENFLRQAKHKGTNVIYFMGFFPPETWLYEADRLGIGVWLELPVYFIPRQKIPPADYFEDLFSIIKRHSSVLAITAATGLPPSKETKQYIEEVRSIFPDLPVYSATLFSDLALESENVLPLTGDKISGEWGEAEFLKTADLNLLDSATQVMYDWKGEKTFAISWLVWLFLLSIQNWRAPNWKYRELFNPNPKRPIRRAFFWRNLFFLSRLGSWAALATSALFLLPSAFPPWFPYDLAWLNLLRSQSPVLIWALLTVLLLFLRFFQVGLATTMFPHNPKVLSLCCWLERRYNWTILLGITWVLLVYNYYWYFPLVLYLLLSLLLFPLRILDIRRQKGKFFGLIILPLTVILIFGLASLRHFQDWEYIFGLIEALISLRPALF